MMWLEREEGEMCRGVQHLTFPLWVFGNHLSCLFLSPFTVQQSLFQAEISLHLCDHRPPDREEDREPHVYGKGEREEGGRRGRKRYMYMYMYCT